jgi:hypothetical protein
MSPLWGRWRKRCANWLVRLAGAEHPGRVNLRPRHGQRLSFEPLESRAMLANLAPINSLPASFNAPSTTVAALTGISISDADAGSSTVNVVFDVQHGTLSLPTNVAGGLTISDFSGNGTAQLSIFAPLSAINATLQSASGLQYTSDYEYLGSDTLTLTTNDLGSTGGPALIDTDTVNLSVGINATIDVAGHLSLLGTSSNDNVSFLRTSTGVTVTINGVISSFPSITSFSFDGQSGNDVIDVFTSPTTSADLYLFTPGQLTITGANVDATFRAENIKATGGINDTAQLVGDTATPSGFFGGIGTLTLNSGIFQSSVANFPKTYVYGRTTTDSAFMLDAPGNDTFYLLSGQATQVKNDGSLITLVGFEQVIAQSFGNGADKVLLYDTPGNDYFNFTPAVAQMVGNGSNLIAYGFKSVYGYASSGRDLATMWDSAGNDTFTGYPTYSILSGVGFFGQAIGFDAAVARSIGGYDVAMLYDSPGTDYFYGSTTTCIMSNPSYYNQVFGFESVQATANRGGRDFVYITGSFNSNDITAVSNRFSLVTPSITMKLIGFDDVNFTSPVGSLSRRQIRAVDYVLKTVGVFR